MNLSDIGKVKEETFWLGLFSLIFLVAPGYLLLFCFERDLFLNLDTMKLLLLSLSITAPFAFINGTVSDILLSEGKGRTKEDTFLFFFLGILVTNIVFYLTLPIGYWLKLSLLGIVFLLIFIDFSLLVIIINFLKRARSKN